MNRKNDQARPIRRASGKGRKESEESREQKHGEVRYTREDQQGDSQRGQGEKGGCERVGTGAAPGAEGAKASEMEPRTRGEKREGRGMLATAGRTHVVRESRKCCVPEAPSC